MTLPTKQNKKKNQTPPLAFPFGWKAGVRNALKR